MIGQTMNSTDALHHTDEPMSESCVKGIESAILTILESNDYEALESITLVQRLYGLIEVNVTMTIGGESKTVRIYANSVGRISGADIPKANGGFKTITGAKKFTTFI